jgi:hypothetical protein
MKVRCKGYKTCEFKYRCYHSNIHELLEQPINNSDFYKCISKCTINDHYNNCNCSSVNLRKDKLSKLNDKS